MVFYICSRQGQCLKPCNENCLYTSDFFKSKLYHEQAKPSLPIDFLKDKRGDWWEVNWDWDNNLPKAHRSDPEELIHVPYDYLVQIEASRKLKKNIKDRGIIF